MSCLVFNSCEFGQLLRVRIITSTWSRHSKTSKTFKLYRSCCCCCDIISIIKIPNVDSFQARSASQFTGKFSLGEINLSDSNSGMTWVGFAMTSGSSSKQNCTVHSRFHGHYWSNSSIEAAFECLGVASSSSSGDSVFQTSGDWKTIAPWQQILSG